MGGGLNAPLYAQIMIQRIKKPIVFLSHSSRDIDFIDKLDNDLRKCQIDTWLDKNEIPHGNSWLATIFEDGIPSCDSVLIYFTENSINSEIVKKEIDAGLVQKLKDGTISFLPYVNSEEIRKKLRMDIQSLQCPIWNENNYYEMLPKVVSEIWRSYTSRQITFIAQNEVGKRLEVESELNTLKNKNTGEIFSLSEDKEFNNIYSLLNKEVDLTIIYQQLNETINYKINLSQLILKIPTTSWSFYERTVYDLIVEETFKSESDEMRNKRLYYVIDKGPKIESQLLLYGFLRRIHNPNSIYERESIFKKNTIYLMFTEKFDRFKYWALYNKLFSNDSLLRII